MVAAILVGVGEYLLHFLAAGPGGEVSMLEDVPLGRASKGHFLVVLGAPFYFAGYYGLMCFFESQMGSWPDCCSSSEYFLFPLEVFGCLPDTLLPRYCRGVLGA